MMKHPKPYRVPMLLIACLLGIAAVVVMLSVTSFADAEGQAFVCNQIPAPECQALEALYLSTGGDTWIDNSGWLVTDQPCSWFGITCDPTESYVTQIMLTANTLSGTVPSELSNLSELTWLDLGANNLGGEIPQELSTLTNLRTLYLAGNMFSGAIPSQLGNLTNLELLYLNRNQLEGAIPSQLGNLENLQFLYLDGSKLSGAVPDSLCSIDTLVTTSLGYNKLSPAESSSCVDSLESSWADTQTVPPDVIEAIIPQAAAVEDYAIEVTWQPISYSTDIGFYEIYMSSKSGGPYELRGRTGDKTVSNHIVRQLEAGKPYYFFVRTITWSSDKNQNELVSADSVEVSGTPTALTLSGFNVAEAKQPLFIAFVSGAFVLSIGLFWLVKRKQSTVQNNI